MGSALFSGVTGIVAHQSMLDVIGNNLANLNTAGYKAQRTLFADLFYQTLRPASGPGTNNGGTNPIQIGSGVRLAATDRIFSQGILEQTGSQLDFAIEGNGFFTVSDGISNQYTRAGAFGLDEAGYLVEPTNGFRVQRIGTTGETDGVTPAFQTPGDSGIRVPYGMTILGQPTTSVDMSGNLPGDATPELAQVYSNPAAPFTTSLGAAADATTLLNDLSAAPGYTGGETIGFTGTDTSGNPVAGALIVPGPAATLGDLVAAIDADFPGATASVDTNGVLTIEDNTLGPSTLQFSGFTNGVSGNTTFSQYQLSETVTGKVADTWVTTIEVFDVQGGTHSVGLTFTKQGDNLWDLTASAPNLQGSIVDGSVQGIQFNDDGTLQTITGTGTGGPDLQFQFNGISAPQTVQLSFSAVEFHQTKSGGEVGFAQDGYPTGSLVSIGVNGDGIIEGFASNGEKFPLAQLAIASFANNMGLTAEGNNLFTESLNSGNVQLGAALSGNRGVVRDGQLESSNVEIAAEFTRLIVAQRGFSANARTITVADEVLEEVNNLIR